MNVDTLATVFNRLSLQDLARVFQTCRLFNYAVRAMPVYQELLRCPFSMPKVPPYKRIIHVCVSGMGAPKGSFVDFYRELLVRQLFLVANWTLKNIDLRDYLTNVRLLGPLGSIQISAFEWLIDVGRFNRTKVLEQTRDRVGDFLENSRLDMLEWIEAGSGKLSLDVGNEFHSIHPTTFTRILKRANPQTLEFLLARLVKVEVHELYLISFGGKCCLKKLVMLVRFARDHPTIPVNLKIQTRKLFDAAVCNRNYEALEYLSSVLSSNVRAKFRDATLTNIDVDLCEMLQFRHSRRRLNCYRRLVKFARKEHPLSLEFLSRVSPRLMSKQSEFDF